MCVAAKLHLHLREGDKAGGKREAAQFSSNTKTLILWKNGFAVLRLLHQRGAALPRLHALLTDCKRFSSNFPLPVIHPAPLHWHNWLTHHPSQWECAAAITTLGKQVTYKQIGSDVSALRPQNRVHPVNFMDEYKVKGNKNIFP